MTKLDRCWKFVVDYSATCAWTISPKITLLSAENFWGQKFVDLQHWKRLKCRATIIMTLYAIFRGANVNWRNPFIGLSGAFGIYDFLPCLCSRLATIRICSTGVDSTIIATVTTTLCSNSIRMSAINCMRHSLQTLLCMCYSVVAGNHTYRALDSGSP